ncbi:MAG TPA: signal recognition particle-docking protein FtsY, partial [Pseudomonas sp.]|nr:signal recognition particle-docking protein FtsY [Pseudomonas sp.]
MFGSNDDKKTPAAAGEKKGLFGWLRKKPQETVAEQPKELTPAPEPAVEQTPVVAAPQIV